jgi:outer membrane protein OmpA-like peptidoglycan-associated protein
VLDPGRKGHYVERIPEPVEPVVEKPVLAVAPLLVPKTVADRLRDTNPIVQEIADYRPYDRTRVLRRDSGALFVHFPLDKSDLRREFRSNAETLDRIVDITRQILADTTSSVKKIQIVGLASIEGSIAGNEQLAQNRALALQRYLQQQVSVPDAMFDTVGGGEAWAEFRDQLNDAVASQSQQAAALREAIGIIDSESDLDQRERKLHQLDKGRTWQYLKEHILKDQRNSGYIRIYYDYVPDKAAATINEASELLGKGQYAEALQMLNTVRTDERCQNALGVALWQTGQQEEALRCFRRAAAQGNADAAENLRQLENATKE